MATNTIYRETAIPKDIRMEAVRKKAKLIDDTVCGKSLSCLCEWNEPAKTAIEYHDFDKCTKIKYFELSSAQAEVESVLRHIECFEFIGISYDVEEVCNPALMLGIISKGHGFVNLPSTANQEIYARLQMKHLFSRRSIPDASLVCELEIHGQRIQYLKLNKIVTKTETEGNKFAYAISTSGSTGLPKIVRVPHSCIVPNILDLKNTLQISDTSKIAQLTPLTFDPSIVEIFLSLCSGGTLFMVSKDVKNDAKILLDLTFKHEVTVLQCTPSLFLGRWCNENLKNTILGKCSNLKVLLLGGEPFPKIDHFLKMKHVENETRVFNIYGITEISCWSSINEIDLYPSDHSEPHHSTRYLGNLLTETIFQVKDESGKIVTKGEGILYIGSDSRICRIDDEEEKDLKTPVFRNSGDLVAIDENGRIYYESRCDSTIKRFGNRVNLIKLERTVLKLSFVKNCVGLWDEDSHKLYLGISTIDSKMMNTDFGSTTKTIDEVKNCLKELPPVYQPDGIQIFEDFELTVNGKICKSSLMRIFTNAKKNCVENLPMPDTQLATKKFERIWKRHVQVSGSMGGFLQMGGDSVIAIQIANEMSEVLNFTFPELIGMLLKDETLEKCVQYICSRIQFAELKNCNTGTTTEVIAASHSHHNLQIGMDEQETESSIDSKSISLLEKCVWQKCRGKGTRKEQKTIDSVNKTIFKIEIRSVYDLRKCVDASPTIFKYSSGEIYVTVGSHSGIICTTELSDLSLVNHKIELPDRIEASVLVLNDFKGIVGCYDGHVYCVHLKTGEIFWKYKTGDTVKCTAILSDDQEHLFVGSYDRHLYCLSVKDGSKIWRVKASDGSISATPCRSIKSDLLFIGTIDGSCVALQQKSGTVIWKRKLENPIFSAPAILKNGVVFCSVSGELACFNAENGKMICTYKVDGNVFAHLVVKRDPATNFESVIVASNNKNVYNIEMQPPSSTPVLKYMINLGFPIYATPCWEGDLLVVATTNGSLHAINANSGERLVSLKLNGDVFSSPMIQDDFIVVGCRDNNLYVLKIV